MEFVLGEASAVVVAAHRAGQQIKLALDNLRLGAARAALLPVLLDRLAMHPQRSCERLDRREQALLKSRDQQAGGSLLAFRLAAQSFLAEFTIFVEQLGQSQLRGVFRQSGDVDLHDFACWKAALNLADIILQTANHGFVAMFSRYRNATTEALGIEDFQQGGETI